MIAIVDYDIGNVGSVQNMLRKIGAQATITRDPAVLRAADKLILPGVGAFDEAIHNLRRFDLFDLLNELVQQERKPILGVCLGAQLMTKSSEEGSQAGLGWLDARIVKFKATSHQPLRIPHMGWNVVNPVRPDMEIFQNVVRPMRFYFVHSYHMVADSPEIALAHTPYGHDFCSVLGNDNILAMQFHPEKSHNYGLQVYRNFVERFQSC
ncbi:imidazole glycerol phosphate synthase subunit HisH [Achromobacter denitrificans]|uniref:imidazole glycerol phosphate synthase subunit HisH n=1 Tax=Achromobacter denitrificans TaxID=32002 RepID=UPI000B4CF480|nr:imidazole glycerol phosphate synthase subunit HisH [Achromobacter denitrificans]ASC64864.1 imidazole glycerol phosphate synthase subunit HisH [Achromobacter denitrificans]